MSETLDVTGAAEYLLMSKDAVMKKARAGKISGSKVGKRWIFLKDDLAADIRRGYSCRYTNQKARNGTPFDSQLAEDEFGDLLERLSEKKPKNTSKS